jgi:hypothetical protein
MSLGPVRRLEVSFPEKVETTRTLRDEKYPSNIRAWRVRLITRQATNRPIDPNKQPFRPFPRYSRKGRNFPTKFCNPPPQEVSPGALLQQEGMDSRMLARACGWVVPAARRHMVVIASQGGSKVSSHVCFVFCFALFKMPTGYCSDSSTCVQEHLALETLHLNHEEMLRTNPPPIPPKRTPQSLSLGLSPAGGSKERMARDMYLNKHQQGCLSWPNWPAEEGVRRPIRYGI